MLSKWVAYLSRSLGTRQAAIEIKWMRQGARGPHDLQVMLRRRARGEPLQYILGIPISSPCLLSTYFFKGSQPFGHLNILVRPPTLIPRPETEQWTLALAQMIQNRVSRRQRPVRLKLLDLCTGSGCIPLLLCHLLGNHGINVEALGIDVSHSACRLARDNIVSSGLPTDSVLDIQQKCLFDDDFWKSVKQPFPAPDLCHAVVGKNHPQLDIITANPPYIPQDQWQHLPAEVKDWEDPAALLGDPFPHGAGINSRFSSKGLTFYERIRDLLALSGTLSSQGILAMEVGDGQAGDVVELFGNRFGRPRIWRDLWGKERAVFISHWQ